MPMLDSAAIQQTTKADFDVPLALVIGSGLAAAVCMCSKGWRLQVLEKLNELGGPIGIAKLTEDDLSLLVLKTPT